MKLRRNAAFSMVELLVTLAIFGVVAVFSSIQLNEMMKVSASIDYQADLIGFRTELRSKVNCDRTIANIKSSNGGILPANGTPVDLVDAKGASPFGPKGPAGSPFESTPSIRPNWFVKSTWILNGIEVKMARASGNTFAKDMLTNQNLDFEVYRHKIFASTPLCAPTLIKNYLIDVKFGLSEELNPLIGLPPTTSLSQTYFKPIGATRLCHAFCANSSYVSGWLLGMADQYSEIDSNGLLVSKDFPPGKSQVVCRCLR